MEQNKKTPYSHSGDKEEDEVRLCFVMNRRQWG